VEGGGGRQDMMALLMPRFILSSQVVSRYVSFFFGHVGRILEYIASIDECLFALFPGTTIYGTSESFPHVSSLFLQGFEV